MFQASAIRKLIVNTYDGSILRVWRIEEPIPNDGVFLWNPPIHILITCIAVKL
jgi:hypothetical protein